MIVFELICSSQHRFEGWFSSSDEFERQRQNRMLSCPVCAVSKVEKLPTAKIKKVEGRPDESPPSDQKKDAPAPKQAQELTLASFIEHVLRHTEDVGPAFAEEARKIHYEEVPRRGIRGVASREETQQLVDEGIEVLPLPVPPRGEWH